MTSPNGSSASETRQEVPPLPSLFRLCPHTLIPSDKTDLDSLACALADAHFAREKDAAQTGSNRRQRRRHVPLFLSRRNDLHLRPENLLALETAQIPVQDLLTIDDLPAARRLATLGTRFSLVDHNVLLDQFRSHPEAPDDSPEDDARVVSILDHHVDERKHLGADPRVIELVGSCSSLVTRQYVGSGEPVPTPLADLLLSAIAIDTRMKPVADGGKAADVDLKAVETLLPFSSFFATSTAPIAASSDSPPPTGAAALDALKAYNSRLSTAKEDVAHLSGHDLLRRDYKEYHESSIRYGLSTVPLSLSTWLEKFSSPPPPSSSSSLDAKQQAAVNELLDEVRHWMDERDLALAGVLTSYSHIKKSGTVGGRRREILIVARGSSDEQAAAFDSVFAGLEKDQVLELGEWKALKDYSIDRGRGESQGGGGGWERWQVWQQGNARATRKQVAPALKDLVHQAFGGSPERL